MADDLSTLVEDFETALQEENVEEAAATFDEITARYEDRRESDLTLAMRSRIGSFDDPAVDDFLRTYLEVKSLRYGFTTTGGLLVDRYQELKDNGDYEELRQELATVASDLVDLEPALVSRRDDAEPILREATLAATVEFLYADSLVDRAVSSGDTAEMSIALANVGDEPADGVEVTAEPSDGLEGTLRTDTVGTLAGGETYEATYGFDVGPIGVDEESVRFAVDSGNAGVASANATFPRRDELPDDGVGPITVRQLAPAAETVRPGAALEVTAEVTNDGAEAGDADVALLVAGTTVATTTLSSLAVESPTEVAFDAQAPDSEGEYQLGIDTDHDSVRTTLFVASDDEPSAANYANANGRIDTDGLRTAVDDWRVGGIDTELLRTVIDHWKSGEPVE